MLVVSSADIDGVLKDFGNFSEVKQVSELQRYDYEDAPGSEQVRLIVKAELVSDREQILTLRYRKAFSSFRINGQERIPEGDHVNYAFALGEKITVEVLW